MTESANLSIKITTDGADQATRSLESLSQAGAKAEASALSLTAAQRTLVDAQARGAPITAKMIQDAGGWATAEKALTNSLNATRASTIAATQATTIGAAVTKAAGEAAAASAAVQVAANDRLVGSSTKVREALVILRELGRGDFTRLAGSATIEANAFGLLTPAVLGTAAAVAALAAPIALVIFAMEKGAAEAAKFSGALIATGNYAGLTSSSFEALAQNIASSTDTTIGSSKKTVEALAESGRFGAASIANLSEAAQDYSRITGENADKFVKEYDGMTDHLVSWAVKHQDTYHDLTLVQIDHIALLVKEGQEAQAQDALAADLKERAKARLAEATADTISQLGLVQRFMHQVALDASWMWDKIMGIGRPESIDQKITEAAQAVASRQQVLDNPGGYGGRGGLADPHSIAANQAALDAAKGQWQKLIIEKNTADAKAASDAAAEARQTSLIDKKYGEGKSRTRAKATPTDETAQRTAQVEALLSGARTEELQAQLGLVKDVQARGVLEQQILAQQAITKQAQVDKTIADIAAAEKAKHILANTAVELTKQLVGIKAIDDHVAFLKAAAVTDATVVTLNKQSLARTLDQQDAQIDLLNAQAELAPTTYARSQIELQILKAQQAEEKFHLQEVTRRGVLGGYSQDEIDKAIADLAVIDQINAAHVKALQDANKLEDAVRQAADDMLNVFSSVKNLDLPGAFGALIATMKDVQGLLGAQGSALVAKINGLLTSAGTGAALGQGLGLGTGKGGIDLGLSLGGAALGGAFASTALASTAGTYIGTGLTTLGLSGGLAASAGALLTSAAVLGPIAAIAALALGSLLKSKPTNAGAGIDFATGALSGGKRTTETEQAAQAARSGIQQQTDALTAEGVKFTDAVNGLVIGTRDQTQIYLASGKTLLSAVGDPAAAAETALKALLSTATYTDAAEKKLVDSMLAAGKGFDDISAALQSYAQAQQITSQLSDAILQLTDPKAFDLKSVKDAIQAQKDAAKAAATAGYLTADQLTGINGQLDQLQGLQIADVMKKYGDAVSSATDDLSKAYDAQSSAIQGTIDKFQAFADSLGKFRAGLYTGPAAALSPEEQYRAAKAQFDQTSALARSGDQTALGDLQDVSQAYLDASKSYYASSEGYFKDLTAVRDTVTAAEQVAKSQVSVAQQQLDQLKAQVSGLITLNDSVLSVAAAIAALATVKSGGAPASFGQPGTAQFAVSALASLGPTAAANDTFDASKYLADNKDVAKYAADRGLDPAAFALQHYTGTGQFEIAAGLRKYAAGIDSAPGGWARINERGPEGLAFLPRGTKVIPNDVLRRMSAGVSDNGETNRKLDRVIVVLEALVRQNGTAGQATVAKLEEAVEALGDVRRQVRKVAA